MKRICIAAVALCFIGTAFAADSWVEIKENMSKIQFPVRPKDSAIPGGKQFVVEREGGSVAMIFAYSNLAPGFNVDNPADVDAMFARISDALTKSLPGSKIIASKDSKHLGKFPMREVDLEVPLLGVYRTRLTVTSRHLYQVTILGPKDYLAKDEAKKFMGSFQLDK